jgi:predicted AAA+ superfamily ATPase
VIHEGRKVAELIQVSADLRDPKVRAREIRGLIKAGHELRCDNLLLLSPDEQGEGRETWQGRSALVRREPIWRWLLEQNERNRG